MNSRPFAVSERKELTCPTAFGFRHFAVRIANAILVEDVVNNLNDAG
jgi:hypothetical protein